MKDLENKFEEVEKRVMVLISENRDLTKRVSELTQELSRARRESQELENFHGKKLHTASASGSAGPINSMPI